MYIIKKYHDNININIIILYFKIQNEFTHTCKYFIPSLVAILKRISVQTSLFVCLIVCLYKFRHTNNVYMIYSEHLFLLGIKVSTAGSLARISIYIYITYCIIVCLA